MSKAVYSQMGGSVHEGECETKEIVSSLWVTRITVELCLIYMRYLHYKYSTALADESYCLTPSPES